MGKFKAHRANCVKYTGMFDELFGYLLNYIGLTLIMQLTCSYLDQIGVTKKIVKNSNLSCPKISPDQYQSKTYFFDLDVHSCLNRCTSRDIRYLEWSIIKRFGNQKH